MTEPFTVRYDPEQSPAEVANTGQLDEVLLRVTAGALDEEAPILAEIVAPDRQRWLHIGLGEPEYSVLLHHDTDDETVHASEGLPVPYDAGFDYEGRWTPAPADSAIPIAEARDAAREFVNTGGQRPSGVRWQTPRYDT